LSGKSHDTHFDGYKYPNEYIFLGHMDCSSRCQAACTPADKQSVQGHSVTKYYKFSDDLPSISEIQRLVAGYPDEEALIGIIMRSYDYIQKLPLQGISEDYAQITAL
ncbi:MAG: hypothetical protein Q8R70_12260, partial [Methanoregula sp.]|nr:hypothetical protein [Methanoregula sp.]